MKKLLLTFMALVLVTMSTFATQVEVTMNAKSKLIKSLVNIATNEPVEVGEPASNKYTFDAADGSYLLTATAADGETVSGTIQLDIDANHTTFAIFSPEINVKNTDWVYGTDYTFNLRVTTKEGVVVNTTMGEYTSGKKMFLVFSGNTYYLDMIPSDARQEEGYLVASYTGTVTNNPTVQAEAPMGYVYNVTVPAEATFFLGTKTAHFVKFKEVAAQNVATEGSNKVYTFKLADKQQYNYRVSQPGKYTQAGVFTMSSDETKRPVLVFTDADLTAKDPKFIDHDVTSNGKYNVGDLFLNINAAGHLKLANVGDTYDILPMRNWQLTNSITANYFVEPDYHFTVVNLNGQEDNSVVKVENELLTAVGTGTAIVLVTYDAIHVNNYSGATKNDFVGGADWGAIWPENTGAFVVTVGEQATDIKPNIIINKDYLTTVTPWGGGDPIDTKLSMENVDAEFDVLYYLDSEDGFDYTFTPEGVAAVTLARPVLGTNAASYTGFSAEGVTMNADDSYTVHLTMGRNIVCLTDAAGKSVYQVITAKPCHREIKVAGEVVSSVKPGDEVTVQYSGLYHPANKLAGIHNFNAFLSYKKAPEGITVKNGKGNQYTMAATATAQAVTFTVPEDWKTSTIELADGVLGIGGFGDPVGNHRATSKDTGRAPNFTAISQTAVFGRVPAVKLAVDVPLVAADFENLEIGAEGHMSVSTEEDDERTEFTSGDFEFATGCMSDYYTWWNFGYANRTESKYESLDDQWNNVVGGGYNNSANYGVAYVNTGYFGPCYITVQNHDGGVVVPGFYVTNSSYAYNSMNGGDSFAKKFGKGDWFKLTITGYDAAGEVTGTKDFYLADLRDPSKAYIINDWRYVDLSGLGKVSKLGFELSSTDNGEWGMNTPAYFCFDNFGAEGEEVLPEKNVELALDVATFEEIEIGVEGHMSVSTKEDDERTEFTSGDFEFATGCMSDYDYWYFFGYANRTDTKFESLDDQWNNVVGGGYDNSINYGVAYVAAFNGPTYVTVLNHDGGIVVPGFYVTNSSYAYNSMNGGDSFAKKFGKGDWFKLTITGYDAAGEVTGTKDFYLADLRDPSKAYIINDWRYVDLSGLGKVSKLGFELSSTDNGDYGMNTPAYFCFDNFGAEGEEVLPEKNVDFPLEVADFENLELAAESHMSVSTEEDDERTEFTSGDFEFATGCMSDYDYWYFFGYANRTKTTFETLDDQWNNVVGGGYDNSANYGVAYAAAFNGPTYVTVKNHDGGIVVPGFYITNSSYAYNSLTGGDAYAKKFGKGDWFKLTITGYDAAGEVTGTKDFYLADLRDPSKAYIINDWRYVDLSGLGKVSKLGFELSSTDNGDYGMNTPAYFCFDNFGATGEEILPEKNVEFPLEIADFENLELAAESHMSISTEEDDERTEFVSGDFEFATGCMHDWASWWFFGYANSTATKYESLDDQWNNIVGGGYDSSANYGVAYVSSYYGPCNVTVLNHEEGIVVPGFYITNSAYAYTSMMGGDAYAKKFGKDDWFKLTITGYDAEGNETGTKDYYLADLRDEAKAYIINDWRYVDLSGLGKVCKLGFALSSTDNGDWGMNTPAYFCFDNFGAEGTEVLPEKNVDIETAISNISVAKQPASYYNLKGENMSTLQKGVNIVRMPDGSVRKIVVK